MNTRVEQKSSLSQRWLKFIWALPLATLLFFNFTGLSLAQGRLGGLETTRTPIGYQERDLFVIGAAVAKTALSFLGVIFVALVIAGGFMWMTAQGNASKAKTARNLLTMAVIGLIIIVSSYTIASWVADTFSAPVLQQNTVQ